MKTKVCGLKHFHNILEVSESGIEYIGFIFYKDSPRYIGDSLSFDEARRISKPVKKVGVFVNESVYAILDKVAHYDLDLVQLHGDESPEMCLELRQFVKIIKAFSIDHDFNFSKLMNYEAVVDHFLFDAAGRNYGGNGHGFDWNVLKNYKSDIPYFLSGGLDTESLEILRNTAIPRPFALDINSKFEIEPGLKDVQKIRSFIKKIRNYENATVLG